MAIDTIPPWVRGPDVLGAISSGASAGAAAGRMEQENRAESERIGMESLRLRQSAAIERARLEQASEQHQMEFQARQKLAEQNQLRQEQRLNIENAYKTAALGIAKGRLEETQAAAEEKARTAALTFQREQAFAREVASGTPVMEAYRKYPVGASTLNAVQRTMTKEDQSGKPIIREGRYPIVRYNPKTDKAEVIYTPKSRSTDKFGAAGEEEPPNVGLFQRARNWLSGGPSPAKSTEAPSKFGHPKAGEVRAGYRFKGGDPNDQKSWEIVNEGE